MISERQAEMGPSTSFDDFYAALWPHAFRLAALMTHDAEAGADIAQDVFATMSRRWATIERPEAYLQRSLTNASSNWRRTGRRAARKQHLLVVRDDDEVPFDRHRRRSQSTMATREADGGSAPVIVYSVSTDELRQLDAVKADHLTWSPDGSTLAYMSFDDEPNQFWLVDADGANQRLLVADLGTANHGIGPVWSPTGDRIAYQRLCCGRSETHEVVLVSIADGNQTVIEPPGWYPYSVTWSPDGTTLLYTAWGQSGALIAVPADAPSDVTVLTDAIDPSNTERWMGIQMWGRQPG